MVKGDTRVDPLILGTTHKNTLKNIKKFDPDYKAIKRNTLIPSQSGSQTTKFKATKLDLCTYLDRPKIPIFRLEHDVGEDDLESFAEYVRGRCDTAEVDLFFCKTSLDEMYTQLKLYRPKTVPLMVIIANGSDAMLKHKLGTIEEFDDEFVEAVTRVLARDGVLVIIGPDVHDEDDNIYKNLHTKLGNGHTVIVTTGPVLELGDILKIDEYNFEAPIVVMPGHGTYVYGGDLYIEAEPPLGIGMGDLQMCP